MHTEFENHVANKNIWSRGLYMLIFSLIYSITEVVIIGVVVLQFGFALFTGTPNNSLTHFGQQLSNYVFQIFRFQTFNSEYKPFPFDDWDQLKLDLSALKSADDR